MLTTCRICKLEASIPAYRLRKSDYRCAPCANAQRAAYRLRRIASGRPIAANSRNKTADAEAFRRSYADPARRLKHMARMTARKAVSRGKLFRQPCEVCGAEKVEAHHDDYGQPLAVRWLCPTHHREHHAAQRALLRAA